MELDTKEAIKAMRNIDYFNSVIYPLSWTEKIVPAPHTNKWVKDLAENNNVAILSARKHLKSVSMYSYIMWLIFKHTEEYEILYLSFKQDLASYHTKNIKKLIQQNPYFSQLKDLTTAEGILKYSWDGQKVFTVEPGGILTFKRGRHPNEVVCDDILADPSSEMNMTVIDKINRVFFEDVMSLPKEPVKVKLVGTAQTESDLFFTIKKRMKGFKWDMYKAITNENKKQVLWPEQFSYKRLIQIRDEEIGPKAFAKEYMCSPVHSESTYFKREQIESCINPELKPLETLNTDNEVVLGWDIGKKRHPSHLVVFENVDDKWVQRLSVWMDGWNYTRQLSFVQNVCKEFNVDTGFWDATRGEFDSLREQGEMPDVLEPMIFTKKSKFDMASFFEKMVVNNRLELLDDDRQVEQILGVNNDLEALETERGHGDSFWSISMALFSGEVDNNIINWS